MSDDTLHEVAPEGSGKNTVPLYDIENKSVVHMPFDDSEGLLKSGKYALPKDYKLPVVSPSGDVGTVDASEASKSLQAGFRVETLKEQKARMLQEEYGGPLGITEAAAAGLVRGPTFGASDLALTKTGLVSPETLSNLEEANPGTSLAAEAAGIIAPAVFSGGFSVAAGVGLRGVAEAGLIAERFVAKQAVKAGLKNAVAKSIVEKIAPKIAGSAVEGAFYGAGQLISEDALGKADLNAETLAGHVGAGMLIGGAFGGAFGTAAELAGPAGKVLQYVTSPFQKKISQGLEQNVASARLFGMTPVEFSKLQNRNPKVAAGMQDYLANKLELHLGDTAESLMSKNEVMMDKAGKEIGASLETIDQALASRPELKPTAEAVYGNIADKIENDLLKPLREAGAPGSVKMINEVENYLNEIDNLRTSKPDFQASDLQKLKKMEDKLIKYNKVPGQWSIGDEMRFITRDSIRNEIDVLAQNLEHQGLVPDVAAQLKAANSNYAAASTFGPMLERRALKAGDKTFSFSGYMKDAALDVSRKLVVMGKIEGAKQAIGKVMQQTVNSMGTQIPKISAKIVPVASALMSSELAKNFSKENPKKPSSQHEAYANVMQNLNKYQQNPQNFVDNINKQTSGIFNAAPKTAGELSRVAVSAMNFLSSKAPKSSASPGFLDAYKPIKMPSSIDMSKFERYLSAISKPASVMKNIQDGTVTRDEMDAFKTVYPSMFHELQNQLVQKLPEMAQNMPYNRRIQLGMLFGVAADQSMQPGNIMGLQGNFGSSQSGQEQNNEGAVNPSQGGMSKLNFADRERTPTQEVAEGEAD